MSMFPRSGMQTQVPIRHGANLAYGKKCQKFPPKQTSMTYCNGFMEYKDSRK